MEQYPIIWDGEMATKPYVPRDDAHYAIQSLDRAIDLLEAFASGTEERGVADLARELGLPRTTVHRLLSALTHRGLLSHDPATGHYQLGLKLFELGSRVGDSLDIQRIARPYLQGLMERSGETAHLVVLDGADIVFVDKVETDNPFRMVSQIGRRLPARFSGSGKALLARLTDDEITRRFAGTNVDLPPLRAELTRVRERGWAIDDEETQPGLRCIGTVVRDRHGAIAAGLSISGPLVRVSDDRLTELSTILRQTADQISRAMGYRTEGWGSEGRGRGTHRPMTQSPLPGGEG
ncbi:MAG TPA: IclR family transcriptional regulator [Chloroflexota bacterium]|nr:IclR family transcriptional regulator [Chloroflexota bacterium]